jgi:cell volume regulation protein A
MFSLEYILIGVSLLLIISILSSRASFKLGIPSLLLFLFIGMAAGMLGLGWVYGENPRIAQSLGVVALVFILFSGGLETEWTSVQPILRQGIALSSVGVFLTALFVGIFAVEVLHFSFLEGMLLGAIVSATDAAAVFSVLRSKNISLSGNLRPLLEFESGSNDPMSVFLTVGIISLMTGAVNSFSALIPQFFIQMCVGLLMGYGIGRFGVHGINRLKLEYDGLYPVLTVSLVLFIYAATTALHGSGFLAVYVAGLVMGNSKFIHRKSLIQFHGGLAWLMQIVMFIALGLLVKPSYLLDIAGIGIAASLFLMFVARPASVFVTLLPERISFQQKAFISWVGLRGSSPIILATFPLLAGISRSDFIFNLVFFTVLTSALIQGSSIAFAARLFGVSAPLTGKRRYPIELEVTDQLNTRLIDFMVPYGSQLAGKTIMELALPSDSLITLVARNEEFIVPCGSTVIEESDVLLIIVNDRNLSDVKARLYEPLSPVQLQ